MVSKLLTKLKFCSLSQWVATGLQLKVLLRVKASPSSRKPALPLEVAGEGLTFGRELDLSRAGQGRSSSKRCHQGTAAE